MAELKLFPFQELCVDKLSTVRSALIGDDMGLGKTVEAIMLDKRKRELDAKAFIERWNGKPITLVVAPYSVLGSWVRHFNKWNPALKVYRIEPKPNAADRARFVDSVRNGTHDVYVIHWQGLRLVEDLQTFRWFHVIADEVHRAKSRKAQQTIALKKLFTDHKLGCSGTPADNRPDDFWSVLNWLRPKQYSSYNQFRDYYLKIKWHDTEGNCDCPHMHKRAYQEIVGCANVDELMEELEPFYVRRLKEEVWTEMPEKYYTPVEVDLSPAQRRAYEDMRKDMLSWVGKHENEPVAAPLVISQLIRLQQFALAHARIETRKIRKRKCDLEPCRTLIREGGGCVGHLKDFVLLDEPSSKLDAAMDIIEDNPGKQVVCFSQSKQIMKLLTSRLDKRGISNLLYTSDTPPGWGPGQRERLVDEFQQGDRRVFAGTISAGGEGIELTAAHTEIFFDRAWSPSKNNQAEDRCHRLGQANAVQVIDLVAKGTIDRGRNQKINLKWSWIKQILGDKGVEVDDEAVSELGGIYDLQIGR